MTLSVLFFLQNKKLFKLKFCPASVSASSLAFLNILEAHCFPLWGGMKKSRADQVIQSISDFKMPAPIRTRFCPRTKMPVVESSRRDLRRDSRSMTGTGEQPGSTEQRLKLFALALNQAE